jgi:hypothetical protein
MTTDRELLEKAAKAAGLNVVPGEVYQVGDDTVDCTDLLWTRSGEPDVGDVAWNPLDDDGDALRLAVAIGPLEFSISEYGTAVRQPSGQWYGCEAHLHGGKNAATRRAIVLAAASLADDHPIQSKGTGHG